ncbi:MAG: rhomboid family intramembrane serine protease [Caldilineales bacterium]|nr:rhomboid family intramembrane serine protease [Caldilineales bacterium]
MYSYKESDSEEEMAASERNDAVEDGMQLVSMERFQTGPTLVYGLIAITVLVFVAQLATQNLLGYDLPAALGIKANAFIARGQYWRLITPVFLHGSIMHLGFNMYALFVLGPGLLRFYGNLRFLALYFLGAFAGNVGSMIFTPAPSLGASTAIFGVFAAQGVFLYLNRGIFDRQRTQRALREILILAVINLALGLSPGIDMWGHVGGLIGGLAFAWFAGPKLKVILDGMRPVLTDMRMATNQWVWAAVGEALAIAAIALLWLNFVGP